MTNGNASNIVIAQVVYTKANGDVDLARADAQATTEVLGFVSDTAIAPANSGSIMMDGILDATTGQWDNVTGGSGGLVAGTVYYLDPDSAGDITATAPTTVGDFVVRVGRALSSTEMDIMIEPPIKL
jgi:hypothetical protein